MNEQQPDPQTKTLLSLIAAGDLTLEDSVTVAAQIGSSVSVAEAASHLVYAFGDHARDAVRLVGLSPSHKLRSTPPSLAARVQKLIDCGGLYPPWREFPWWPEPSEPM